MTETALSEHGDYYGPFDDMLDDLALDGAAHGDYFELQDSLLKEDYQGFAPWFWLDLQDLHDQGRHWSDKGLTGSGKKRATAIRKRIKELVV